MALNSKIEWTHHTFNPWWGCQRVSPACEHCYAERMAGHVGRNMARLWHQAEPGRMWGPGSTRVTPPDSAWDQPVAWNRDAIRSGDRRRVFCASMADVFEDRRDLDPQRARLWNTIALTPSLDWLLLTKRPEHVASMVPASWMCDGFPRNVWMGVTAENQAWADRRIAILARLPAAVRFISAEPLLGAVDLAPHVGSIDWVITGGESGPGARGNGDTIAWYRSLRDVCARHGIPFLFKQWGNFAPNAEGGIVRLRAKNKDRQLDGREWNEFPEPRPSTRSANRTA